MHVGGVCNFLGSVSSQQKFERTGGWTSVTAPCYQLSFIQKAKENTSSRHEGGPTQKTQREEKPEVQFGLLFLYVFCFVFFFLFPLTLPYVNWASQEGCVLPLRFSLQSSDLLCSIFTGFFLSLSFSHHYFGLIFPTLAI